MTEAKQYASPDYKAPFPKLLPHALRGRGGHEYIASDDLLAAANAAIALNMPLLLTGEAGCGKTEFAWAAGHALEADVLEAYVRSESVARDLLYQYDAIRRFGDAQHGDKDRAAEPRHYVTLNALGRALVANENHVVLIDEIDKAPRDLPNDLLRELEQGWFTIPEIEAGNSPSTEAPIDPNEPLTYRQQMGGGATPPFIVITSNVERQLPDPFLRRCIFFHIAFPDAKALADILQAHFANTEPRLLERAITVFRALRKTPHLTKRPATSELINWVEALSVMYEPKSSVRILESASNAASAGIDVDWRSVPALGCLVKLREDHSRLCGSS